MTNHRSGSLRCLDVRRWIAMGMTFCLAMGLHSTSFAQSELNPQKDMIVSTNSHSCAIRFNDPYGGWVSGNSYAVDGLPHKKTGVGDFSISFACLSLADTYSIRDYTVARYDKQKGHWEPDFSGMSERDRKLLKPVTQWLSLKAGDSSGFGALQDMTNSDPKTRSRSLGFCLLHPPIALCGSTPVVAIPYYSKVGVTPNALRIIRSIAFVNMPVADSTETYSASTSSGRSKPAVAKPK